MLTLHRCTVCVMHTPATGPLHSPCPLSGYSHHPTLPVVSVLNPPPGLLWQFPAVTSSSAAPAALLTYSSAFLPRKAAAGYPCALCSFTPQPAAARLRNALLKALPDHPAFHSPLAPQSWLVASPEGSVEGWQCKLTDLGWVCLLLARPLLQGSLQNQLGEQ